jgi:phosphinothricin acetyltransferase
MVIRPAGVDDFPAIAELTNVFIRSTAIHFAFAPITDSDLVEQWRETERRYPWLTAEIDGSFAGYAKAGPWRTRSAYQWTAEAGIYIQSEYHGRGVGKRLYSALIAELRQRGFHSVIGGMTMPNEASVRLHQSLGFEYVGTFRQAGFKLDQWHDVAFWQLRLRDVHHVPA